VSEGLKFDLTISTSKAAKQAQKFVTDLEKKLHSIPFEFDTQAGVRGLREIKKEAKAAEKSIDRLFGLMAKNAQTVNNELEEECDLLERMIGLRKQDMNARVSSAKKEQKGLDDTDARIKRNTKSQATHNKEVMRGLEEQAKFRQQQIERAKARYHEDAQRFGAGAASNVHGANANSAALDAKVADNRAKIERDEKRQFDKRASLLENFLHRREILQLQYNQRDENLEARHQAILTEIQEHGASMRLVDIRRTLERETVLYAKSLQKKSQVGHQGSLFGVGVSNKTMQGAFQAQQMIEDFSYAGFRGASNNIAMLAASMGGPGGLIVLGGVAALTLGSIAKEIGLLDGVLPDARKSMDDFVASIQRGSELRQAWFEKAQQAESTQDVFSLGVDLEKGREHLDFLTAKEAKLREQRDLMNQIIEANQQIFGRDRFEGGKGTEPWLQMKDKAVQALIERHGFTGEDIANFDKGLGGWSVRLGKSGEDFDDLNKRINATEKELARQNQENQQLAMRLGFLKDIQVAYEHIADLQLEDVPALSGEATSSSKAYSSHVSSQRKEYQKMREEIEKTKQAEINRLMRLAENTGDRSYYEQALEKAKQMREEIERLNMAFDSSLGDTYRWAEAWGQLNHFADETVKATEKAINAEYRLIETINKRIEALKRAKEENQTAFQGKMFDLDRGLARKQSDEALKRLTEGNRKGLDRDLAANEAQFAPILAQIERADQMASLMGAGATGAKLHPLQRRQMAMGGAQRSVAKQMLQEEMQRRAEMIKSGYEGRQERGEKNIQKELEEREAKIQAQHEKMLRDRADMFGKNNDLEGQMDVLKELQGLQIQQAGQAQTSEQMMGSKKSVEQTQKEIQDLYDKMTQAEEQKKVDAELRIKQLQESLTGLTAVKETLSAIDVITDRDVEKARGIEQSLKNAAELLNKFNAVNPDVPTLDSPDPLAGIPVAQTAGVQGGQQIASTTNHNNTSNTWNVAVNGMPARPSLTIREAGDWAAKQASLRTGLA